MTTVKRRTPANIVVQHDNGSVESIPLSPKNKLLFDHNLWGVLQDGSEILKLSGNPGVTITPNDDSTEFTIVVGDAEPLHIGEDMKGRLMDALKDVYTKGNDRDLQPLIDLHDRIRDDRVRRYVVDSIVEMPPFSQYVEEGRLEVTSNGWLFGGELLLTWNCDFRHPETTSRKVSGSSINPGSADSAYDVSFNSRSTTHTVEVDDNTYRLTNDEMDFMARALWAAEIPTPS
jgi:hypothetical protein